MVGVRFLWLVGAPLLPFIVVGGIIAFSYTDYLTKYGVGAVGAGLGLGALPVAGTALVQGDSLPVAAIAVSILSFFLTLDLLMLNEFPDENADRQGGRRTLVQRFGRAGAVKLSVGAPIAIPAFILGAIVVGILPINAVLGRSLVGVAGTTCRLGDSPAGFDDIRHGPSRCRRLDHWGERPARGRSPRPNAQGGIPSPFGSAPASGPSR